MTQQFELDFEGGLSTRHHSLLECLDDCIGRSVHQKKVIAADLDLSPSGLSRRLSVDKSDPNAPRFSVELLEMYIEKYHDLTPVYYLVEKFCQKPEDRKRQAISQLADLVPMIQKLVRDAA